jgi:2-methylcitrate dehydratase PrpD
MMENGRMNETLAIAEYISSLDAGAFPRPVVEKTKELVLDQLGCELAGSTLPWSKKLLPYFQDKRPCTGISTVVQYGLRTGVEDAAFMNACFGRSTEVDDIDEIGKCHIGSTVIPTALAVGESRGISGRQFIESVVAGYDVASRVAAAIRPAMRRGFHTSTVAAPLAAAATACNILRLDAREIANAIGVAASHASGLMEFSLSGGSVNRLHGGIGASGGVRSACLAQRGFEAPGSILEGKKGFCPAFADGYSLEELTRGLGSDYRVLQVGLRRYCCCGTQSAGLDALGRIMARHVFSAEDIQEILVGVPGAVFRLVGSIVQPRDLTSSQYSGRFGIALKILKGGNTFRQYYQQDNLRDPELLKLIGKISYVLDDELERLPWDTPTRLTIRLTDGTVLEEQVDTPQGGVHNPLTRIDRLEKFRELASTVFSDADRMDAIIQTVEGLDELDDVGKLAGLLGAA